MEALVRRDLLKAGGATLLATGALAGCDALSTSPGGEKESTGSAKKGAKQAPDLSARVSAGKLPPLKERLPDKPMVVRPVDRPGTFGGTLRRGETNMESPRNVGFLARASLMEWGLDDVEPVPALAESYEAGDGGRVYTFVLRAGVKWSDGKPFTADDLAFYHDAVLANKKLTPVAPGWLRTGDTPVKIVKVDRQTVEFRFAEPNALLPRYLAMAANGFAITTPAHYLQQFHPDYVSAAKLKKMTADAKFDSWSDLFAAKFDRWMNPDLPVLGSWKVTEPPRGSSNRAVMERNPYYWKVDTDGKQLPYVDRIVISGVADATATLQAARGDLDLQASYISIDNMPVLAKNAKKGGYRALHWITGSGPYLYTSQSHKDPVIRKLMQDIDFRAALSHAIDRHEMNKLYYGGLGETTQPVCLPQDPYHVKGSGHTFVKHDVAKANQLLDKVGLSKRDGEGFRLRPDGKQMTLHIATFPFETGVDSVDAYGMVKKYWEKVGLRAKVDNMDGSLWRKRIQTGNYDIAGYDMGRYMWDIDPLWYVPTSESTYWAPLFGLWYSSEGAEGERPPKLLRKLQQTYDRMKEAVDDKERVALGQQIQKMHDEQVWVIGTVTAPFQPVIVNADMINVKKKAVNDYRTGYIQITWPEQVSYEHPQNS